ncbi:MAG: RNA polymerase sigma factor [Candidatus Pacebacteria bacterium]|nr:RNA polymerase sigma factor [Candidatus Paceibacterota bacterium]
MNGFDKIDSQNIAEYLNGNEDALEMVIERHFRAVYNFIYRLVGNKQNASDITQEVFVKVWKNIKKYKNGQSFKTWLFAIAKNTSIDWLRKKKEYVFSEFENEEGENVLEDNLADPAPIADKIIANAEKNKLLDSLLEKLPINYKTVLLLRYEDEFTFEEIGEVLGKPLNTVKSQNRRALIALRGLLMGDMHQKSPSSRIKKYGEELREALQEP